nr:MAG TPA: hypothetical protein [Caudoviricetes sp.]
MTSKIFSHQIKFKKLHSITIFKNFQKQKGFKGA